VVQAKDYAVTMLGKSISRRILQPSGEALGRARLGARPTLACDENVFIHSLRTSSR
jgi:hypothetical protein